MHRAIELSQIAYESGKGLPIGCVIVKDNKIISEGHNEIFSRTNPTAHGEMVAIENACKNLGNLALTDCAIYTTLEPCPMCLEAIYWDKLNIIYFANSNEMASKIGFSDSFIFDEINFNLKKEKKFREKKKSLSDSPTPIESNHKTGGKEFIVTSSVSSRALHLEPSREARELNPTKEDIKTYFQKNNFPELEAQKFFNYFSSVGWLVGGKTPMVDWQAAAQNWMLNSINFNHNTITPPSQPQHHNRQNYAEPI